MIEVNLHKMRSQFAAIRKDLPSEGICANCGNSGKVEQHHIVPLAIGGSNNLTNIVGLCESCHLAVHGKGQALSPIEMTRRLHGKVGRPQVEFPEHWESIYKIWKAKKITAVRAMEILKLKKNSFYTLVKRYEEQKD